MIKGTYFRWTKAKTGESLVADILGDETIVIAHPETGMVSVNVPDRPINPDEARMIGVRIIEAAAYAGKEDAVRRAD